jgi:hypothetical protein
VPVPTESIATESRDPKHPEISKSRPPQLNKKCSVLKEKSNLAPNLRKEKQKSIIPIPDATGNQKENKTQRDKVFGTSDTKRNLSRSQKKENSEGKSASSSVSSLNVDPSTNSKKTSKFQIWYLDDALINF